MKSIIHGTVFAAVFVTLNTFHLVQLVSLWRWMYPEASEDDGVIAGLGLSAVWCLFFGISVAIAITYISRKGVIKEIP